MLRGFATISYMGPTGVLQDSMARSPTCTASTYIPHIPYPAYPAHVFQRLPRVLPDDDRRGPVLRSAAGPHAEASRPAVCGGNYMVEHWLACYAVLLLT